MYYGKYKSFSGTVTAQNMYGLLFDNFFDDSGNGTITAKSFTAIKIKNMIGGLINAETNSGLWIDKIQGGTTNRGIVLAGDGAGSDIVFGPTLDASIYSNGGHLYAKDVTAHETLISPHDPETGEWIYYSKNVKTGEVVRVDMEKLVKAVEKLTGEKFMVKTMGKIEP